MRKWALNSLLLKSVHITDINQGPVIGIIAATEVIVVMVVIEIRAALENSEDIIVDITEIMTLPEEHCDEPGICCKAGTLVIIEVVPFIEGKKDGI